MRLLIGSLCLLLVGCIGYEATRDANKANLAKINLGDSKSRVLEVCGSPDKNEQFAKGGSNYNVLFYYTDYIGEKSWETGHTPVIVKDGVVTGIGWRALEINGIKSSDITIETKRR